MAAAAWQEQGHDSAWPSDHTPRLPTPESRSLIYQPVDSQASHHSTLALPPPSRSAASILPLTRAPAESCQCA